MKYKLEKFDAQKFNDTNFLFRFYSNEGSKKLVELFINTVNENNEPLLEPFYFNYKLLGLLTKSYQIKGFADAAGETIVIYDETDNLLYWFPLVQFILLSNFIRETNSDEFSFGYMIGTHSPSPNKQGMHSANNIEGYTIWIKNTI